MRNTWFTAILNLHINLWWKPCRNVRKRVLHRWNLVELPLQAAGNSYLSEKRERNEGNTEKPRTEKALVLHQRSAQLSPNSRIAEPEKPSAPQNRPRSERIEPDTQTAGRSSDGQDKPQTTVADRKPERPAERPMVPDKPKTRYTMPKDWTKKPLVRSSNSGKPEKITRKQRRSESRGERK